MNLYQIDEEIMKCVDMETGEIVDAVMLDQLQMDRNTKIENIACWIKNLNADVEAFKKEKQTLAERQKAAENRVESLKKYLAYHLAGQKFSTPRVAISFRKTSRTISASIPETTSRLCGTKKRLHMSMAGIRVIIQSLK